MPGAGRTHGPPAATGIPCAMVLWLIARSPRCTAAVPGFVATVALELVTPRLDPKRREIRTTRLRRP
jgi:hypothetical protein